VIIVLSKKWLGRAEIIYLNFALVALIQLVVGLAFTCLTLCQCKAWFLFLSLISVFFLWKAR